MEAHKNKKETELKDKMMSKVRDIGRRLTQVRQGALSIDDVIDRDKSTQADGKGVDSSVQAGTITGTITGTIDGVDRNSIEKRFKTIEVGGSPKSIRKQSLSHRKLSTINLNK